MNSHYFDTKKVARSCRDANLAVEEAKMAQALKDKLAPKLITLYESIEGFTITFFDRLNENDLLSKEEYHLCFWQSVGLSVGSEKLGELLKEYCVNPRELISLMYQPDLMREGTFAIEQALRYGPLSTPEVCELLSGYSGQYLSSEGDFDTDSRALFNLLEETFRALKDHEEMAKALETLKAHPDPAPLARLFGLYGNNYTAECFNATLMTELPFILEDQDPTETLPVAQAVNAYYDPNMHQKLEACTWTLPTKGRYLMDYPWLQQAHLGFCALGHPTIPIVVIDQSDPELFAKNKKFITKLSPAIVHAGCDDVLELLDAIDPVLRGWVITKESGEFHYSGARNAAMLTGPIFAHCKRGGLDWRALSQKELKQLLIEKVYHGPPISMGDDDLTVHASTLLHYVYNESYGWQNGEFNITRTPCLGRMTAGNTLRQPAVFGKYLFSKNAYYMALFVGCMLSRPCLLIPTEGSGEESSVNARETKNQNPLIGPTPVHFGGTRGIKGLFRKTIDNKPSPALQKRAEEYFANRLLWLPNNIISDTLEMAGSRSICGHGKDLFEDLKMIGSASLEVLLEGDPGANLEGTMKGCDRLPDEYKEKMLQLAEKLKKITHSRKSIDKKREELVALLALKESDTPPFRVMKRGLTLLFTGKLIELAHQSVLIAE